MSTDFDLAGLVNEVYNDGEHVVLQYGEPKVDKEIIIDKCEHTAFRSPYLKDIKKLLDQIPKDYKVTIRYGLLDTRTDAAFFWPKRIYVGDGEKISENGTPVTADHWMVNVGNEGKYLSEIPFTGELYRTVLQKFEDLAKVKFGNTKEKVSLKQLTDEEKTLLGDRLKARKVRDYATADNIRNMFNKRGFELEDVIGIGENEETMVTVLYKNSQIKFLRIVREVAESSKGKSLGEFTQALHSAFLSQYLEDNGYGNVECKYFFIPQEKIKGEGEKSPSQVHAKREHGDAHLVLVPSLVTKNDSKEAEIERHDKDLFAPLYEAGEIDPKLLALRTVDKTLYDDVGWLNPWLKN